MGREGREALHEFGCLLERRVGRVGGEGLRQFFLCAGEDSASVAYGDDHKVHTAPVASEFIQQKFILLNFVLQFKVSAQVSAEPNFNDDEGAVSTD